MGALVSVIVPVYNSKAYLKRCVDAIISQTYSNDNGEFLVNLFEGYGFECGECEEEEFYIFGMYVYNQKPNHP